MTNGTWYAAWCGPCNSAGFARGILTNFGGTVDVGGGEAAVHEEGRAVHVRRLVAGEEERAVGDLLCLGQPAHRQVDEPTFERSRSLVEEPHEERRLHGAGAQRIDAHASARELDGELPAQGEDGALRGGVGDLRRRRAGEGHERGDVDDRAAAALEQMRDPVLAAEEDALRVDVLHALPRLDLRLEDRGVVRGHDPRVVVEDVDSAVALGRRGVHGLHAVGVGDVHLLEEGLAALGCGRLALLGIDVGDADACALLREEDRGLPADAAGGAGDDGDFSVQASHAMRELNREGR